MAMNKISSCILGLWGLGGLGALGALGGLGLTGCDTPDTAEDAERLGRPDRQRRGPPNSTFNRGSYSFHLQRVARFHPIQPGSNPDRGRALFGVAADLVNEDDSQAFFEGVSAAAGGREIVANGRTCFTCHRGSDERFGMPQPPLSEHIPLTDPLFTEIDADAQGDPDAFENLDQHGLFKYRVNRFDPRLPDDDPYSQVFAWRKSPQLLNVGLNQGFLNDLRGRTMFETARGAVFAHTQEQDDRFDDLFTLQDGNDMEAFMFSLVTDERLLALRDPTDPLHDPLIRFPFLTVPVETRMQRLGKRVFKKYCFSCHNTPQVFSGLDNVEPLGPGDRLPNFPAFAPPVGRTFNVGVAEWNRHGLRFTHFERAEDGSEIYEPVVIPLAREDGSVLFHEVEFDIGLAMTSGRAADIGRFKVPQLRNLAANAPYFHDNSAATIEEVVDYFNSEHYNNSRDGRRYPIRLNERQRAALIEFLKIL